MLNEVVSLRSFQEIMSDVLISILRGQTEEEITEKVLNFKKSMTELDIKNTQKTLKLKT